MARLTIDLPDSLHRELKKSAASLGISMREFVLQRITAKPADSQMDNRWANLAAELQSESLLDGLSDQLQDKTAEFRNEFATDKADW